MTKVLSQKAGTAIRKFLILIRGLQLTYLVCTRSVRISSKKSYSSGLFIADFGAMPAGCGIWPAW